MSLTAVTAIDEVEVLLSEFPSFTLKVNESEVVSPPLWVYVICVPESWPPAETAAFELLGSVIEPLVGAVTKIYLRFAAFVSESLEFVDKS